MAVSYNNLPTLNPSGSSGPTLGDYKSPLQGSNAVDVARNADKSSWIGTAIAGTLALGGTIASNIANKRRQKESQQFAKEQVEDARKYDTPSAQMQRLREAGINPLSADIGNVPSQQVQNPQYQNADYSLGDFAQIMGAFAQNKLTEAQIKNIEADTEGKNIDNQTKSDLNLAELANLKQEFKLTDKQIEEIDNNMFVSLQSLDLQQRGLKLDQEKFNFEANQTKFEFEFHKEVERAKLSQGEQALSLQLSRTYMQNLLDMYSAQLTNAQIDQVRKDIEFVDGQIDNLKAQNAREWAMAVTFATQPVIGVANTIIDYFLGSAANKRKPIGFGAKK